MWREGVRAVLKKCVNPFCNRPFRRLSEGKLFVVEFPQRLIDRINHRVAGREHFWLCEECARIMTLAVRREFDTVSVRIINQAPNGSTKLKFDPAQVESQPESPAAQTIDEIVFTHALV
jgi:hypothetical protein